MRRSERRLRRLAREEEHFLDSREVHGGSDHREVEEGGALVLDGGDAADGDTLGEEGTDAGGHDQVSRRHVGAIARHELEAEAATRLSLHEPRRPRALHHRPHRGGGIVQELDDGGARPDLGDAAHQSLRHDGRHLLGDAVGAAAVDGERASPAAAFAADDLTGEGGQGQPVAEAQEAPQPPILLVDLARLQGLHAHALVVGTEGGVLRAHGAPVREHVPGAEGAAMNLGERALEGIEGEGEDVTGARLPAPSRLHGEEEQRGEEHPQQKRVFPKSHRLD
jgi:hypothetical protein